MLSIYQIILTGPTASAQSGEFRRADAKEQILLVGRNDKSVKGPLVYQNIFAAL